MEELGEVELGGGEKWSKLIVFEDFDVGESDEDEDSRMGVLLLNIVSRILEVRRCMWLLFVFMGDKVVDFLVLYF